VPLQRDCIGHSVGLRQLFPNSVGLHQPFLNQLFLRGSRVPLERDPALLFLCLLSLALLQEFGYSPVEVEGESDFFLMEHIDLPQGTLDLLILRTLAGGPQHGWAISERVQQVSSDVLRIQQGSLYPALHRLERRGWIKAKWGTSDNNRRAKYYDLTRSGTKQLEAETDAWRKLAAAVAEVLESV
jgi:PadR family transcriptional regulator, regulatory protein PadR